jgi:hypothetical protein
MSRPNPDSSLYLLTPPLQEGLMRLKVQVNKDLEPKNWSVRFALFEETVIGSNGFNQVPSIRFSLIDQNNTATTVFEIHNPHQTQSSGHIDVQINPHFTKSYGELLNEIASYARIKINIRSGSQG